MSSTGFRSFSNPIWFTCASRKKRKTSTFLLLFVRIPSAPFVRRHITRDDCLLGIDDEILWCRVATVDNQHRQQGYYIRTLHTAPAMGAIYIAKCDQSCEARIPRTQLQDNWLPTRIISKGTTSLGRQNKSWRACERCPLVAAASLLGNCFLGGCSQDATPRCLFDSSKRVVKRFQKNISPNAILSNPFRLTCILHFIDCIRLNIYSYNEDLPYLNSLLKILIAYCHNSFVGTCQL